MTSVKDLQLFVIDDYHTPELNKEHIHIDAIGDKYKQLWGTEAPEPNKEQWFIDANGSKVCIMNSDRHCSTGPAMYKNRTEFYYRYDMLHNLNGPAVICRNGSGFVEYWIDGYEYNSKEEFDAKVKELTSK